MVPMEPKEDELAELIHLIGTGDRASFTKFYDQFSGLIYSTALRVVADPEEAAGGSVLADGGQADGARRALGRRQHSDIVVEVGRRVARLDVLGVLEVRLRVLVAAVDFLRMR